MGCSCGRSGTVHSKTCIQKRTDQGRTAKYSTGSKRRRQDSSDRSRKCNTGYKEAEQVLCEDSRHVRISVEPVPLINGGDEALDEAFKAVNKAVELIQSEKQPRAILFETALHGDLLNLDEEDKKRGYAGGMSANRINAGLGTIISQVLEQVGREKVAGLYTTGGDTMVNVCYQLGVECIEVMDYVIPQTDVGRLVGKYDGLPVVGKGGLTGNDNTACDIVERLFKESAR